MVFIFLLFCVLVLDDDSYDFILERVVKSFSNVGRYFGGTDIRDSLCII